MQAFSPHSLEEALEVKAAHHEAVPVAGGTDLMVEVNFGRLHPPRLLDLSHVGELNGWERDNGSVFLGAAATFAQITREPGRFGALADASVTVGSPEIRNRATIGGNLATASPAGDAIPPLAAWDAEIVVGAVAGARRHVPWHAFLTGPKRTALEHDELILGARWKVVTGPGAFAKVGPRNANVIAVAGVCVQLDEVEHAVRVALGSVAPTVVRAPEAETFAAAVVDWDDPTAALTPGELAVFGNLAAAYIQPIDDVRGSADYRRHVVAALARRLLTRTLEHRRW
jgi:CO/xanthine dehydrogenase FAD-binding subunit